MRRLVTPVLTPVFVLVLGLVAFALVPSAAAGEQFGNTSSPTIKGSAAVGTTLTLDPGRWTGSPDRFTVQWLRDGEDTIVSTSRSYVPVRGDAGHFITALVTAERTGKRSTSSAQSDRVPVNVFIAASARTRPTVSGTARVGQRLTARNGAWDGAGYRFGYRWLANNRAISGAVKSTYTLKKADGGKKISVRVTASKSRFPATASTSTPTRAIAKK